MSGIPKRLNEEGGRPATPKHVVEESNLAHGNQFLEMGQDGRSSKFSRTEAVDKRSPLHSMYQRMNLSAVDSSSDHQESKVDARDSSEKEMKYHRAMDVKERGKRFPEAVGGERMDMWHVPQSGMHGGSEIGKEGAVEERVFSQVSETVGENKVDFKGGDKMKEKERERKRKDEKHRDASNGVNEHREMTREERESERWGRERKDVQKEKERPKDREKDHVKKEPMDGAEKESLHNEKVLGDGSVRVSEQEGPAVEQRRHKEFESLDRDAKEKRTERHAEGEGDRHEKRSKGYDKELDDGYVEGDGGSEREREAFAHGIQQRRRMLRPRGSPQVANRDPRFRSRARENEESQDKSDISILVYKVGDRVQEELIKLWKEFEASQDKSDEISCNGPTLEIRIPAEDVTATNRQVRGGQLWGTDIYTDDSDLVAVLMHTGYCRPTASPPPSAIQELRATIRILPPQKGYISTLRNNVRSRAWGDGVGCSYRVEHCCIIKKEGGSIDLEPCLTHTASVEPTLAPVAVERTITTRAAASNALRQQKFVREVTIQYNLCNEPWIKYGISIVADKGLKKALYTSARLKKGEVLYLETHSKRYELCFNGEKTMTTSLAPEMEIEKSQNHNSHEQNGERCTVDRETATVDVFRWSRCKIALPQELMRKVGIPLPLEHIEVLEENLDWEDVQWSQTGVWIAGKEYVLARVHFLSPN